MHTEQAELVKQALMCPCRDGDVYALKPRPKPEPDPEPPKAA